MVGKTIESSEKKSEKNTVVISLLTCKSGGLSWM